MCCPDESLPIVQRLCSRSGRHLSPGGRSSSIDRGPCCRSRSSLESRRARNHLWDTTVPRIGLSLADRSRRQRPSGTDRGGWSGRDGPGTRAFAKSPGLHPVVLDIDVYRFRPGGAPEPVVVSPFGDLQATGLAGRPPHRVQHVALWRRACGLGGGGGRFSGTTTPPRDASLAWRTDVVTRRAAYRVRLAG